MPELLEEVDDRFEWFEWHSHSPHRSRNRVSSSLQELN